LVEIVSPEGPRREVPVLCDTLDELEYFRYGGILNFVLRQLAG
jgi:aconitate hydratase A / 2-methylisocitrate dehydratase